MLVSVFCFKGPDASLTALLMLHIDQWGNACQGGAEGGGRGGGGGGGGESVTLLALLGAVYNTAGCTLDFSMNIKSLLAPYTQDYHAK